jgi:hypothetical protein
MSIVVESYVGHVLLDMFLKFGATGPIGGEDDPSLKGDNDLGFGGGMQLGQVQPLQLLLVHHYDVHTLLELVDNTRLQVLVEGNQSLTGTAPGRMHVDYQQFGIFVGVVREEVLGVPDYGCQLHLLSLRCHYLSYIITRKNRDSNYHSQNRHFNIDPTITPKIYNYMINLKYFAFCKGSASLPVLGVTLDKTLDESLKV